MSVSVGMSISGTVKFVSNEEFFRLFGGKRPTAPSTPATGSSPRLPAETVKAPTATRVRFVTHPELPLGQGHVVCPRCLMFHGVVSLKSDLSRAIPPLHPNCYCEERPIIDPALLTADQPTAPEYKPGEFIAKRIADMTEAQVGATFGKGIGKLLKAGIIDIGDIVSKTRGMKTLREIADSLGLSVADILALGGDELRFIVEHRN